jgi:hypothetical protein
MCCQGGNGAEPNRNWYQMHRTCKHTHPTSQQVHTHSM